MSARLRLWNSHQPLLLHSLVFLQPTSEGNRSLVGFDCYTLGCVSCLFGICSAIICVFGEVPYVPSLVELQLCVKTSNRIQWQNRSNPIQSGHHITVDLYRTGPIKVTSRSQSLGPDPDNATVICLGMCRSLDLPRDSAVGHVFSMLFSGMCQSPVLILGDGLWRQLEDGYTADMSQRTGIRSSRDVCKG